MAAGAAMYKKLIGACVGLAMMGMAGTAQAIPIELSFNFDMPAAAPADPWTGTIIYDAASTIDPILSLISINMTVQGHIYTLGEIGFSNQVTFSRIGATINLVGGVQVDSIDFGLFWLRDPLTPLIILLTAPEFGIYEPDAITEFSVSAIPEPSTLALFATGLALLAFFGWRQRSRQRAHAAA